MRISMSNNPIDRLSCWLHNKKEDLSRVQWLKGKQKKVECRICGGELDSKKDTYSPMQCGWHKVTKYSWICHRCFDHRNFRPFIEMIDDADRKEFEENNRLLIQIDVKAKEIITLLKEYLPKYQETLDLYYLWNLDYRDEDGNIDENNFSIIITDKNEEYVLEIRNTGVSKVSVSNKEVIEIANYLDEEKTQTCTKENPWTWDDAIEVIKKRLEER